jgi:uncharacterized membrane protein YdjX (TVP38/TMEM64 family)
MHSSTIFRTAVLLLLVAAAIAGFLVFPVKDSLAAFLDWVHGIGPLGPVVLALAYIPASLLFIPGSFLTLGAGFAFGPVWGTIAVSAGSVMGATAAYLTGRLLVRDMIERRVAKSAKFGAIDRAVAEQGFKIVLLTRLSPIFPFNLLNYAYGLTRVRLRDYVLASWIGMLPGTLMYVYLGSAVKNLADLAAGRIERSTGQTVLFFVGLVATIVVTIFVTRIARQALDKAVSEGPQSTPGDDESSIDTDVARSATIQGVPHVS